MINGHKETQKRLKKEYNNYWKSQVSYRKDGDYYVECGSNYPKRTKKSLKKFSNRRIRQCKRDLDDGNYYRKVVDMWWIIY